MYIQTLLFGSNEPVIHLPYGLTRILLASHSGLRYIILILLVMAIIFASQTSKGKRLFTGATKKYGMFTMILADIQLVIGALLYFNFIGSQSNFRPGKFFDQLEVAQFRSIAIDHALGMVIAIILIHIGYSRAKKAPNDQTSGKRQFTFYLIALIIILLSIPWPFLPAHNSRGWF